MGIGLHLYILQNAGSGPPHPRLEHWALSKSSRVILSHSSVEDLWTQARLLRLQCVRIGIVLKSDCISAGLGWYLLVLIPTKAQLRLVLLVTDMLGPKEPKYVHSFFCFCAVPFHGIVCVAHGAYVLFEWDLRSRTSRWMGWWCLQTCIFEHF